MARKVRVRFAPSPTGPLHIGGVRTALYNYLFAKKHNGIFILRIEDTDQKRFVEGAEDYINESLAWLGISPDEGVREGGPHAPYRQSERMQSYAKFAQQLVDSGHAYYSFDTADELTAMREKLEAALMPPKYDAASRMSMKNSLTLPEDEVKRRMDAGDSYVVRIKLPRKEEVRFYDEVRGWVLVHTAQMDDKVLLKGDGMPTYHLANVVDDHQMEISHVIRGEEWLPSAPLHVLLYRYLGWEETMPKFAHLSLLLKPDGKGKLSKRDGDRLGFPVFPLQWVDPKTNEISSGYREAGYLPKAVVNMLALLGWHPSDNQEEFTLDELIKTFSLEKVSKSGARFDADKANWFNHQYLMKQDNTLTATTLMEALKNEGIETEVSYVSKVVSLMKEKVNFAIDIVKKGMYFFKDPETYDEEVVKKKWNANSAKGIDEIRAIWAELDDFNSEQLHDSFQKYAVEGDISAGSLMQPLRLVISGALVGPPLFEMIELLSKETALRRMANAVTSLPV